MLVEDNNTHKAIETYSDNLVADERGETSK